MSGTIHLYRDGRVYVTTDEEPPLVMERMEMVQRTIADGGILVLGPGWDLKHEPMTWDGTPMPKPPNPVKPTEDNCPPAVLVFALGLGGLGFLVGLLFGTAFA